MTPVVEKIVKALKKADLTLEDRTALTTAILDKLQALPLNDSVVINGASIEINGKALDQDQAINLKQSCISLQDNYARKLLHEQVRYLATNLGMYKATNLDQIFFFKAALWCLAEENKLVDKIIGFATDE